MFPAQIAFIMCMFILLCTIIGMLHAQYIENLQENYRQFLIAGQAIVEEEERPQRRAKRFKAHPDRGARTNKFHDYWRGEEARFIEAYRMSKNTFEYILNRIRPRITKEDVVGDTIEASTRLAVCLSRLCRGMYFYTIAEMYGIGESTAQQIYNETIRVIVDVLYNDHVLGLLPHDENEMRQLQGLMNFPYAFGAVDGCHLRIQCPIGVGARRDYWCYKQFYSIILMAIVDGKGRFLWACAGMPGNCHDSTLLQGTALWPRLKALCEVVVERVGDVIIPGMILGDNAFTFRPYLMKRYSQAVRTPEQRVFNKCHASSRVIIENSFGLLKMRFRELFRGSESKPENLKFAALAAVTLHNIMIARREAMMLDNPERPAEGILFLEAEEANNQHAMAARVREAILPLTQ